MSLFNRGEGARNRVFLDKVTAPPNVGGAIADDDLAITGQGNGPSKARLQPCFAARANYLFPAIDRKEELADRSGHPIPSGNSGLNLTDQGYRSWPVKVTAHIHWKDSKQERSMEVEFREVCLCSE
jgi:hypothetical protein